jgi:hypothetical protein
LVLLPLIAAFLLFLDWHQNGFIRWAQWPLLGLGIAWMRLAWKPGLKRRFGFFGHALMYVLVCGILAFADVHKSGQITWSLWPMLGWGFGLGLHGLSRPKHSPRKSSA